jgi:hypothetical protein
MARRVAGYLPATSRTTTVSPLCSRGTFEPDTSGRPHLVTAAAVREGVDRPLEAESLIALWLLVCVASAIDRRMIARGRVGLVRDRAITVDLDLLTLLGFRCGRKTDGYDGDYYVFEA